MNKQKRRLVIETETEPSEKKKPRNGHSEVKPTETTVSKSGPSEQKDKPISQKINPKNEKYVYGNYTQYYGYRNPESAEDGRFKCLDHSWLTDKDVLDVGCNTGQVTLKIASELAPRKIIGIDIDHYLIKIAKRNVRHYLPKVAEPKSGVPKSPEHESEFPISFAIMYGPLVAVPGSSGDGVKKFTFPNNVFFIQGNYVLENDSLLEMQKPEFDTILCLSLTKWIHLNWGDEGLKRAFKRMFLQLRPGGKMVLESQSFETYGKKKGLTPTTLKNYYSIKLRPEKFTDYLLSPDVGFTSCQVVDNPYNKSKGFQRPIQVFTKSND